MVSVNLLGTITAFALLGMYTDFQMLLFATIPGQINVINEKTLRRYGIQPTPALISAMSSVMAAGVGIGMLTTVFMILPLMDKYGRKFVCVKLRFFFGITSAVVQVMAGLFDSTELFIMGQILVGLSYPIRTNVTVMFVGECSPDKNRGFASISLIVCDVIASLIVYATSSPSLFGGDKWIVYPIAAFFMSIALFLATIGLPESPKWLAQKGHQKEALRAINFYHNDDCDNEQVYFKMIQEKNLTKEEKISVRGIWSSSTLREGLKIIIALQLFQVTSPAPVERMYTVTLHSSMGLTVDQSLMLSFVTSLLFAPTRFIGTYTIDLLGRRPIIFIAGFLMYIKVIVMLCAQYIAFEFEPSLTTRILVVVSETLSELIAGTGLSALGMLLTIELFPPAARVSVAQILVLMMMASSTPVVTAYPVLNAIFPPAFYFPLLVLQPIILYYVYKYLPETKARAVYDIVADLDCDVRSRVTTMDEQVPLLRGRAKSHADVAKLVFMPIRPRASSHAPKMDYLRQFV